jgi:PPOX class probable F420-dependent enzyme
VDPSRARDFAREHHRAIMITRHADGRPQTSPVLCAVDGAGKIIVSTRETAAKTRNLLRDPQVTFCLFTDAFFGEWVQVDGEAEVLHQPEAMEPLIDYYRWRWSSRGKRVARPSRKIRRVVYARRDASWP